MEEAETIDKLRGIAQGLTCKKAGSKKNVLLCRRSSFLQSVSNHDADSMPSLQFAATIPIRCLTIW